MTAGGILGFVCGSGNAVAHDVQIAVRTIGITLDDEPVAAIFDNTGFIRTDTLLLAHGLEALDSFLIQTWLLGVWICA